MAVALVMAQQTSAAPSINAVERNLPQAGETQDFEEVARRAVGAFRLFTNANHTETKVTAKKLLADAAVVHSPIPIPSAGTSHQHVVAASPFRKRGVSEDPEEIARRAVGAFRLFTNANHTETTVTAKKLIADADVIHSPIPVPSRGTSHQQVIPASPFRRRHLANEERASSKNDDDDDDDDDKTSSSKEVKAKVAAVVTSSTSAAAAKTTSSSSSVAASSSSSAVVAVASSTSAAAAVSTTSSSSASVASSTSLVSGSTLSSTVSPTTTASSSSASSVSKTSSSASATATKGSTHTGFTLTDSKNKLYPLWIAVFVVGLLGAAFMVFCLARCIFFRPAKKEHDDDYLSGGSSYAAAGTSDYGRRSRSQRIRAGAKSIRRAFTSKNKLAGSSFARRTQEGSVLLEVGDEVFAVPAQVAEEYNAAKRMSRSSSSSLSSGVSGGTAWNGKACLERCLSRHASRQAGLLDDRLNRSSSTLVSDSGYDEKYSGQAAGDALPKRGLSAKLAEGFRAFRGQDEDEDLGDPEKTTDLNTFLPAITQGGQAGWGILSSNEPDPYSVPSTPAKDNRIVSQPPRERYPTVSPPVTAARGVSGGFELSDSPSAEARARTTARKFRNEPVVPSPLKPVPAPAPVPSARVPSIKMAPSVERQQDARRERLASEQAHVAQLPSARKAVPSGRMVSGDRFDASPIRQQQQQQQREDTGAMQRAKTVRQQPLSASSSRTSDSSVPRRSMTVAGAEVTLDRSG